MPILNLHFKHTAIILLSALFLVTGLTGISNAAEDDQLTQALSLTPNIETGRKKYVLCAACHGSDGFGQQHGEFPSISGQHQNVIVKQILDIQSKKRINPTMFPFSDMETLGGLQGVVDIAAYTAQLPSNRAPVSGDGSRIETGAALFKKNCTACHGADAAGDNTRFYPRLTHQHYPYLVRELGWIRDKIRKNADPAMVAILQNFSDDDIQAVADFLSQAR